MLAEPKLQTEKMAVICQAYSWQMLSDFFPWAGVSPVHCFTAAVSSARTQADKIDAQSNKTGGKVNRQASRTHTWEDENGKS